MRQKIMDVLYSMIFSCAFVLSTVYFRTLWWERSDYTAGLKLNYLNIKTLLFFMLVTYLCYKIVNKVRSKIHKCKMHIFDCEIQNSKDVFSYLLKCNLVVWGIWFLVFAPGCGMNDTLNALMSAYRSNNQPIAYQMLIWYGVKIFKYLSEDMTWAFGCVVLIQMFFCAYVFASLLVWVANKGVQKNILKIFILYYSLLPIIADYSITLVKDTLFAVFLLAFVALLYDIVNSNGEYLKNNRNFIKTIMVLLGVCLFRNNGVMVCIASLVVLLFMKNGCKKRVFSLIILCLLINIGTGYFEQIRFNSDVKFREALGVPIAQVGAVLNDPNANFGEEDVENLNQVLPIDIWRENYRPSFADKVKFDGNFDNEWLNENKTLFIKTWFHLLTENFPMYVKAYICHSYGYWGILPYPPDMTQSYFTKINNNTSEDSIWGEFCSINHLQNQSMLPIELNNVLDKIFKMAVKINMLCTPGLIIWIIFLCITILLGEGMYRACVPYLPIIFTWGTMMIASPASLIYRYSYYLVLTLPIVVLLTIKQCEKGTKNCEKKV